MKIAEDLEQILVVLHTLLVIIEMTPHLTLYDSCKICLKRLQKAYPK